MSVLNTMLRDLERRGARPEQPSPNQEIDWASAVIAPERPARRRLLNVMLWSALWLAACAGVAALWLRDHPLPWKAAPTPAATLARATRAPAPTEQPTPAAQPLLAPPITPTVPAPAVAAAPSGIAAAPSSAPAGASEGKPSEARSAKEGKRAAQDKPVASPPATPSKQAPTRPTQPKPAPVQSHPSEAVRTAEPSFALSASEGKPVTKSAPAAEAVAPAVAQSLKQSELARAIELIARGRSTEAAELLAQALAAHPDLNDARATLAALQAEGGDRRQALATLLAGVPIDARRFALTAAQLQAELNNPAGALQTLDRVPVEARGAAYHALAAAVAQRAGQHQLAVTEYGAALGFDPANTIAWVGMGISLQALGRDADALQAFRSAARATLSSDLRAFVESRIRVLKATTEQAALPAVGR